MSVVLDAVTNLEPQTSSADIPASATEQRLKSIIETAPVSLMVVEANGKVMAANRAALKLRGAQRLAEFVGKNVCQTVAQHDRVRFAQFVTEVCGGASGSLEYDLMPLSGSTCTVETHAVPLQRDGSTASVFLGITHDVSERHRLESALRRAEAKLEALDSQRASEKARETQRAEKLRPAKATPVAVEDRHKQLLDREAMIERMREADRQASHVEQVFDPGPKSPSKRFWQRGK